MSTIKVSLYYRKFLYTQHMEAISLIRFKKDLRVTDHAWLHAAISSWNRVIALYCFEPSLMNQPDWSSFHGQFTKESLIELHQNLNKLNLPLLIFTKEIQESFCLLQEYFIIKNVFSYEETGNMASYMRDIAFGKFCKKHSIIWKEFPTNLQQFPKYSSIKHKHFLLRKNILISKNDENQKLTHIFKVS